MPASRSLAAVTGPTPHSASTGSCCRNASTRSGATTVRPSGFFQPEATLARNLLGATPADAVRRVVSRMASLIRCATTIPSVSPQAFSVTSRYASSSESGSTSGVTDRKISNTDADTSRYFRKSGLTRTSCGHSRSATALAMAEWTPNRRAS